ncbi:TPA: hypothetical protein MB295_001276, partial [Klebsiella pneumoniae]|nr:hypothetical protein [Klebsiella pneumoniae]
MHFFKCWVRREVKDDNDNHLYILNGLVNFDVRKRVIYNDYKKIELSAPGAQLLALLIHNANKLVTRDSLLQDVWEQYNLTPSNGNL